jgi:hypothetical protein
VAAGHSAKLSHFDSSSSNYSRHIHNRPSTDGTWNGNRFNDRAQFRPEDARFQLSQHTSALTTSETNTETYTETYPATNAETNTTYPATNTSKSKTWLAPAYFLVSGVQRRGGTGRRRR